MSFLSRAQKISLPEERKELFAILAIILIGIFLRTVAVPQIPPGLYQDEAAAGYEAYSLLLTGRDKWGNNWPLYFHAWGAGQNVLYSYLSIPIIRIIGLSTLSIRIVNIFFGIIILPLFYAFTKRLINKRIAYISTLLLVFSPWHIMMSRWGLESNLFPFFLLLGFFSIHIALRSKKYSPAKIITSLVPWSISLYSYGTSHFIIPSALILLIICHKNIILNSKRYWFISFAVFLALSSPVILFLVKNFLFFRIFAFEKYLPFTVPLLTSTPLRGINPLTNIEFIINGFQDHRIWNSIPGLPNVFMILFPFLCAGYFLNLSNKKNLGDYYFFRIWLQACFPLFFLSSLNVNRANSIFLPAIVISVVGFESIIFRFKDYFVKKKIKKFFVSWLSASIFLFVAHYFFFYSDDVHEPFNYGLDTALTQAKLIDNTSGKILVSDRMKLAYVYILFYDNFSPIQFQESAKYSLGENGVFNVYSFGRFYFDKNFLEDSLKTDKSFAFLLKSDDPDVCLNPEITFSKNNWKVGRCSR